MPRGSVSQKPGDSAGHVSCGCLATTPQPRLTSDASGQVQLPAMCNAVAPVSSSRLIAGFCSTDICLRIPMQSLVASGPRLWIPSLPLDSNSGTGVLCVRHAGDCTFCLIRCSRVTCASLCRAHEASRTGWWQSDAATLQLPDPPCRRPDNQGTSDQHTPFLSAPPVGASAPSGLPLEHAMPTSLAIYLHVACYISLCESNDSCKHQVGHRWIPTELLPHPFLERCKSQRHFKFGPALAWASGIRTPLPAPNALNRLFAATLIHCPAGCWESSCCAESKGTITSSSASGLSSSQEHY